MRRKGGSAGPGFKVDAATAFSGPVYEIQEVSRVGAQGVTSKSKLLARDDRYAQWRRARSIPRRRNWSSCACAVWRNTKMQKARVGYSVHDIIALLLVL